MCVDTVSRVGRTAAATLDAIDATLDRVDSLDAIDARCVLGTPSTRREGPAGATRSIDAT